MASPDPSEILHRPSRRRWPLPLAVAAALAVAGGAWLTLGKAPATDGHYRTEAVRRGPLVVTVTATGTLEPLNQVEVGSELSGTVRTVSVDFNDRVAAGAPLAQLDTEALEAHVLQSRASLAAAQAQAREAEATAVEMRLKHQRCARLEKQKMCPGEELDSTYAAQLRAEAQVASAEAQVAVARAALTVNETSLRKSTIRAPIDGIVLDRQVEPGQTVAASLQTPVLFVLAEDLAHMELHVAVDEADIGQVAVGQGATFTVDAYPERTFPAHISQVRFAPESNDGVVTYGAVLAVDNSELLLRPGMTATAEIEVRRLEEALLVPGAALRFEPPRARGEGRRAAGGLAMIMPRPPRPEKSLKTVATDPRQKRLWRLEQGVPVALPVHVEADDGVHSAVSGPDLHEGLEVIVAREAAAP